jgi:ferric-dicitrate binding protein FerR (iron transport regulator)
MFISRTLCALLLFILFAPAARADLPENCVLTELDAPPRFALRCAGTLVIEMEAATRMGFVNGSEGVPSRLTIEDGTVLIEIVPGSPAPQVRTPNAIAAVRGTTYAVDVDSDGTAIFVLDGMVSVGRRSGLGNSVQLGPGEGIDIAEGTPLEVKTWGAARADALLARFGR